MLDSVYCILYFNLYCRITLYNFGQERIPLEEVFEQLRTSRGGLSAEDAEARLQIFGPNKLEERKVRSQFLKISDFMQFLI